MRDVLIGIDAGTSVIKAVAFEAGGRQIAAASVPNRYATLSGGGVEQDAGQTWADTVETLRQLAGLVPDLARRVIAVAVTGQGDGTWLIDRDGEPVGKSWLWLDARAGAIVEDIRGRPEDRLRFEKTGAGLAACQQGPQLIYIKRHMPELLSRATTAFHCKDWLYFKLTGKRATDPSEGSFSFGDFRTRAYSDEVIGVLGLEAERRLMAPIVDGAAHSDGLSQEAARLCGLPAGTPIVLGYVDVVCTALGAGLLDRKARPGCTIIGSTGMHMRLLTSADEARLNDEKTGYIMAMPAPGCYAQLQSNMASTLNIDWVLGLASNVLQSVGKEHRQGDLIALMDRWIAAAEPASLIYHPYISEAGERGPIVDVNARASILGLSSRHGYADLVRAVVEGLAYAGRDCYSVMGPLPDEIRLTGGAARSASLRGLFGSVLGASVRTSTREEAGAAGAAMTAAVCVGLYDTLDACAAEWVAPLLGAMEAPDAALGRTYDDGYKIYRQARLQLRPLWQPMAELRKSRGTAN